MKVELILLLLQCQQVLLLWLLLSRGVLSAAPGVLSAAPGVLLWPAVRTERVCRGCWGFGHDKPQCPNPRDRLLNECIDVLQRINNALSKVAAAQQR